jgi:hypothetical protein
VAGRRFVAIALVELLQRVVALSRIGLCRFTNGVVLVGKFDGEFASHSSTYAGTGTVRYTW